MRLGKTDIHRMVNKCLSMLTEATTTSAVYEKYYKDKLPKELWNALVSGQDIITPFHTRVANMFVSELEYARNYANRYGNERFRRDYLKEMMHAANTANRAWNMGENIRQFLINTAKEDFEAYSSLYSFSEFIRNSFHARKHTENEYIAEGLFKFYEDDDLLVTCTTSYSASHRYYGDSHWCTASDIGGTHNGFEMFLDYTGTDSESILVQFVNKRQRDRSYQAQYSTIYGPTPRVDRLFDFYDHSCGLNNLVEDFGEERIEEVFAAIKENFRELAVKTSDTVISEKLYYEFKNHLFLRKNLKPINDKVSTPEFLERMKSEFYNYTNSKLDIDEMDAFETDSFVFNVSYMCDEEDEFLGNGYRYGTILVNIRTEYYLDQDDQDGVANGDDVDRETMAKSFFTPQEINVVRRAENMCSFSVGAFTMMVRCKPKPPGSYTDIEIINAVKGYPVSYSFAHNRILKITDLNNDYLYDKVTGQMLLKIKQHNVVSVFDDLAMRDDGNGNKSYVLCDTSRIRNERFLLVGKYMENACRFVMYSVDTYTAEVRKINEVFDPHKSNPIYDYNGYTNEEIERESASLLTEATTADVYQRFYSDTIPQLVWNTMTQGTVNMTIFHRMAADALVKTMKRAIFRDQKYCNNSASTQAKYKLIEASELISELWNGPDSKRIRQFLLDVSNNKDFYAFSSASHLCDFLKLLKKTTKYSENEFITDALYKAYEDDNLLVTVTLSYSASHRFYGDSRWCTASGIGGIYNGFTMFRSYVTAREDGLLVQFVNKKNRNLSYQACVKYDGGLSVPNIHDFFDVQKDLNDLYYSFGYQAVNTALETIKNNFHELHEKTEEFVNSEDLYYKVMNFRYVANKIGPMKKKLESKEFLERLMWEMNNAPFYDENAWWHEDVKTVSFLFEFGTYLKRVSVGGVDYCVTPIFIRTNYIIREMANGQVIENEEAKSRSFFNDEERELINRASRIGVENFSCLGTKLLLFKGKPGKFEAIKLLDGDEVGSRVGKIVKLYNSFSSERDHYDMTNGELVFKSFIYRYPQEVERNTEYYVFGSYNDATPQPEYLLYGDGRLLKLRNG